MEEIKINVNMAKKKYNRLCRTLTAYSHFRIGRNIFSVLLFVIPFLIGCKCTLALIEDVKNHNTFLPIMLGLGAAFTMFLLALSALALLCLPSFYKNFLLLSDTTAINCDMFFRPTGFSVENSITKDAISIEYHDCGTIFNCRFGISLYYLGVNRQYIKFLLPKIFFTKDEKAQIKRWQHDYLSSMFK